MPTGGHRNHTRTRAIIFIDEGNLTGICSKLNRSIDWIKLREFLSKDRDVLETFVYAGLPPMTTEWVEFRQKRERFLHWLEAEGFFVVRRQGRPTTQQAYKANVDDDRESPSYRLMDILKGQGAEVAYYDPHVPAIRLTREHAHWAGTKSAAWNRETVRGYDVVLISTAHKAINYEELAEWAECIVDTRNATAAYQDRYPAKIWKA